MLIKNIEPEAQSFDLPLNLFYGGRGGSQCTYVKDRETLDTIIDIPCLESCRYLFDCNILTLASSANKTNITTNLDYSKGFISIDYSSLDDNNKIIFHNLVENGLIQLSDNFEKSLVFNLEVPITEETTAEDFSSKMLALANYFQRQQVLYGYYTLEEFQNFIAEQVSSAKTYDGRNFLSVLLERLNKGKILENPDGEIEFQDGRCISFETLCQEYANEFGYYYDEEEQKFWIDKELYEKAENVKREFQTKIF